MIVKGHGDRDKGAGQDVKKVITYGTFDTLHYGHILLLQRARALGDHLTVALSSDAFNRIKGKASHFDYAQRHAMLEAIRYVDAIIPEDHWDQKRDDVTTHGIHVFTMGDDWAGKFDFLSDLCEVTYLPRTPSISSTAIKLIHSAPAR
ncbi:Glycerol-3-phosphate cytidylyltransferase [Loktanella atrilutea]|uniref:Glycerol-3-phosphate cytidylyltransferase n=1 Tax=Loktanella atrilutea TaxID=366533 RepID=A0A1M5EMG5_LOKAT|nr:Glycerol-3-phosphate cytidylyltransferase [Loktanella atrilutea]